MYLVMVQLFRLIFFFKLEKQQELVRKGLIEKR